MGYSIGAAVVLLVSLIGSSTYDDALAIVLGGYLPLARGDRRVAGIVALSRRRTAFWYPLVALVLSIVIWMIAGPRAVGRPEGASIPHVGPVGLEPTTRGLKVRCSTD